MKTSPRHIQWNSAYFKKIFLAITLSTLSILVLTLLFLYARFKETSLQQLDASNYRFMQNASENIQYKNNSAQKNALSLYTSNYARPLLVSYNISVHDTFTSLKQIDHSLMQDPDIHSLSIYNGHTNQIYTVGSDVTQTTLEEFNDPDLTAQLLHSPEQYIGPIVRNIPNSPYSTQTTYVCTYIYKTSGQNQTTQALVVNLDLAHLFGILNSQGASSTDTAGNYFVYTADGLPLYHSLSDTSLSNLSATQLMSLLQQQESVTTPRIIVDGEPYSVTTFTDKGGWRIASLTSSQEIANSFQYLSITILSFFIFACLISFLIVYGISHFLYSPIKKLSKSLQSNALTASDQIPKNEFVYIEESIQKATNALHQLSEFREKNLSSSQTSLLREQILYNRYSAKDFFALCKQQEIPYTNSDTFVLMYCTRYEKNANGIKNTPQEASTLNYAISNVFYELMEPFYKVQHVYLENNDIVFLCAFSGATPQSLSKTLQSIQITFLQHFNAQVHFSISSSSDDPALFQKNFQKVQEISRYTYFYSQYCILFQDEFAARSLNSKPCELPDLEQIETALRSGNNHTIRELLSSYFSSLPNHTIDSVNASISLFAARLMNILKKAEQTHAINFGINFSSFHSNIIHLVNLSIVQEYIFTTLDKASALIQEAQEHPFSNTIEQIVAHVDKTYTDPSLCSKFLAEEYRVSLTNLNKLFKQKTGHTVSAYLKKIRMDNATRLLLNTNLPVEVCAQKVGFENTKYFYTLFKKEHGVSPATFRINNAAMNNSSSG